ncbi:MAG: DUF2510 domain-containing protein [Candidatus Nanopelagicales bacterium]
MKSRTKKIVVSVAAGVALLVAIAGGVVWKIQSDQKEQVAREQAAAAQQAADAEAAQVAARKETVAEIEASVTKMAKHDVAIGALQDPVSSTQCSPADGNSLSDLTQTTTKFECLAVTDFNGDGTVSGYTFHALMNWDTGSYTYGIGA